MRVPASVLLALLLAGCARLGIGTGPADVDVIGAWVLDHGSAPAGPIEVPDGWRVTLVFDADGVHGQACNYYGGQYDLSGSSIVFSEMAMTEMACEEPMMTVESAYHRALGAVDTVDRVADTLTLSGPDAELVFRLLPPVPDAGLQGTHWILDTLIEGETASSVQGDGWLELRADGSLAGSTGCRALSGRYVIDGDRVVATDLRADGTCSPALSRQDAMVVEVLGDGFGVAIDGGRMTVSQTDGTGLGYAAPGPD